MDKISKKSLYQLIMSQQKLIGNMHRYIQKFEERITILEIERVEVLRQPPKPKHTAHRKKIVAKLNKIIK